MQRITPKVLIVAFVACWLAVIAIAIVLWSPKPIVVAASAMLGGYLVGRLT